MSFYIVYDPKNVRITNSEVMAYAAAIKSNQCVAKADCHFVDDRVVLEVCIDHVKQWLVVLGHTVSDLFGIAGAKKIVTMSMDDQITVPRADVQKVTSASHYAALCAHREIDPKDKTPLVVGMIENRTLAIGLAPIPTRTPSVSDEDDDAGEA